MKSFKPYFAMANGSSRALVILLSGAGGSLPFVNHVSDELCKAGLDVLKFNSLKYFFYRQRSPQELANDLNNEVRKFQRRPHPGLILIGYSQGADVLPFALNHFSAELRERVKLVVLMGLAKQADFKIRLIDIITGGYSRKALETRSEVLKIKGIPLLCLYGENDRATLCRELGDEEIECLEIKGGHMFLTNWKQIADLLLKKIQECSL